MSDENKTWEDDVIEIVAKCFASLESSDPIDELGLLHEDNREVDELGYKRQPVEWELKPGLKVINSKPVHFPEAESDWGVISYIGVFVNGRLVKMIPAISPRTVNEGNKVSLLRGYATLLVR